MPYSFDIIVIGGGHAGIEAAAAAARMGANTLLLTHNIDTIGQMSCNPSIGGIGKGHLVKEIDALGGIMARAADFSGIQFRILNASKGQAVRATRAQIDRILYKQAIRKALEKQPNLSILQQTVDQLIIENNCIRGVITHLELKFYARAVILTAGTFLNGKIHIGLKSYQGGRAGDPAAVALANNLRDLGLKVDRLKTGTPPRIDGNTIDYSKLQEQPGDKPTPIFSFLGTRSQHPEQINCHIAHTNERTHEIIKNNLDRSPLYTGVIEGTGPRYCPSIEDKIVRFAGRTEHQIFLEPEGLSTHEVYPNGISTSLPFDVQIQLVRSMIGLENARLLRPGYAIEYDFFDPRELLPSLETRQIKSLFFAGQINGTTGYEEAAAQGLIAGINAALQIRGEAPWTPRRDEAYVGVMIDDLLTRGTSEPYRMFTSRAEYRLLLREDNADLRLTETGAKLGVVDIERMEKFETKRETIEEYTKILQNISVKQIDRGYSALELLRRPEITSSKLVEILHDHNEIKNFNPVVMAAIEQIEIQIKYEGYIARQHQEVARHRRHEETKIPLQFDYDTIKSLSNEVRQKLKAHRPTTIGQASRISGITPAAISILLISLSH